MSDDSQVDAGVRDAAGGFESMILGSDTTAVGSNEMHTATSYNTGSLAPTTPSKKTPRGADMSGHDGKQSPSLTLCIFRLMQCAAGNTYEMSTVTSTPSTSRSLGGQSNTPLRSSSLRPRNDASNDGIGNATASNHHGSTAHSAANNGVLPGAHWRSRHQLAVDDAPTITSTPSRSANNAGLTSTADISTDSPSAGRRERRRPRELDLTNTQRNNTAGATATRGSSKENEATTTSHAGSQYKSSGL